MADAATEIAPVEDVTHDSVVSEREADAGAAPPPLVEAELLVEDVSIDGMCGVYQARSAMTSFDLGGAWGVDPQVALRPEPFGALAYHFGTRRLSFLKTQTLLAVVQALADHPTAREACTHAGVTEPQMASYTRALESLAASGMIRPRSGV